ncbi:hypothetical protein FOZ63_019466 [Perkinsus olseni]|uniref:Uncharacterized protein n=2 Tax=Perkinsus olseni TaxID=32597 RepID=A0A7J6QRQ3_PEROL|nr:hypothetical protein FOZ63_019466 [Perkinsus olseni]
MMSEHHPPLDEGARRKREAHRYSMVCRSRIVAAARGGPQEESAAPALPEGPNVVSLEEPTSLAETARSKLSAFTNREKARLHTEEEHKENSMNTGQVGASHPASLVQAVDSGNPASQLCPTPQPRYTSTPPSNRDEDRCS